MLHLNIWVATIYSNKKEVTKSIIDNDVTKDTGKVGYMRIFVDKFDIAQYFPGYLRNKELWDDLRNRYVSYDTLCAMVTGKVDINWWKKQKSIVDAWQ